MENVPPNILPDGTPSTAASFRNKPDLPQMPEFHDHDLVVVPVNLPPGSAIPLLVHGDGNISRLAYDYVTSPRMSGLSSTSRDQAVKAIGLLYDCYRNIGRINNQSHLDAERFLDFFCKALIHGTIQTDGSCPFGLYWKAKNWEHASAYIRHAQRFLQFLFDEREDANSGPHESRFRDFSISAYHREKRAHFSLLFHLKKDHVTRKSQRPTQHGPHNPRAVPTTNSFPADKVWSLILDGCQMPSTGGHPKHAAYADKFNVRNQLAYLLIFMGGIRESNLFHIYVNDVFSTAGSIAQVNLYHPAKGAIRRNSDPHGSTQLLSRQEYLRQEYRLTPRHMLHKKMPLFAGWKNLLLTQGTPNFYSQVHWIHPDVGRIFWRLHCIYISGIRPINCNHPYYFVSFGKRSYGEPWKLSAFLDGFRSSVRRIGLIPSKLYGTTPHGGRHFYGATAADLRIEPRIRQVMMMHRHIASQQRYQVPSPSQINQTISQAFDISSTDSGIRNDQASESFLPSFFDPLAFLTSEIDILSAVDEELKLNSARMNIDDQQS